MAQTPGKIWQAPISSGDASATLASPHAWRRADTVFFWSATGDAQVPARFAAADDDIENTSIALALSQADSGTASVTDFTSLAETTSGGRSRESNADTVPLAEAKNVARHFGSFTALHGVDLEVLPGEVVGVLGGNGAGKTTLMRILLGLETPSEGSCRLFGRSPSLATRSRIGYVAQGTGLYPSLSALENLEFAAAVHGVAVTDSAKAFAKAFGREPVSKLPLGTKRILSYLAAVAHDPELFVLDEPTSGMDALTRARLWLAPRALADRGTGILVTTHYMQEAAQCDRLVMLTAGRVSAAGTEAEITASAESLTVEGEHWQDAFTLLRDAGLPVLLHGRVLRIPGANRDEVERALGSLQEKPAVRATRATLEETMMLAAKE